MGVSVISPRKVSRGVSRYVPSRAYGGGLADVLIGSETQGLAIDFTDGSMVIKDTTTPANNFSGNPNTKFTYSSPSTKWVLGSNGLYQSGTTLRTEYDTSGVALGDRFESARTNRCLWSQQFTNAVWALDNSGATNPVVTDNFAISPDGTQNAARIQLNKTGGTFSRVRQAIVGSISEVVTHAIWMKSNTGATFNVGLRMGTNGEANQVVTSTWQRFTLTATLLDTDGGFEILLFDSIPANDETADILVWQADSAVAPFATSPILTTTVPVTRTADVVTLATSLFPYSATAGTLYARFRPLSVAAEAIAAQLDDGTANERINIGSSAAAACQLAVVDGGVVQTLPLTTGTVSTSAFEKLAASWKVNDFAISSDGGAAATDTLGTLPTLTTLRLGSATSSLSMLNGHLQALLYLPRDMSDAELAVRSAS